MIKNILKALTIFSFTLFLVACEKKISHEHKEIHWDRDMCDRCKMVISERNYAAQVVNPQNGNIYKFDDLGCVVLWFKEENITWKDSAKIWVADVKTSKWLDARVISYDTMNVTPMAYGFGAHENKSSIKDGQEIIDFNEVSKRVSKIGR